MKVRRKGLGDDYNDIGGFQSFINMYDFVILGIVNLGTSGFECNSQEYIGTQEISIHCINMRLYESGRYDSQLTFRSASPFGTSLPIPNFQDI